MYVENRTVSDKRLVPHNKFTETAKLSYNSDKEFKVYKAPVFVIRERRLHYTSFFDCIWLTRATKTIFRCLNKIHLLSMIAK